MGMAWGADFDHTYSIQYSVLTFPNRTQSYDFGRIKFNQHDNFMLAMQLVPNWVAY